MKNYTLRILTRLVLVVFILSSLPIKILATELDVKVDDNGSNKEYLIPAKNAYASNIKTSMEAPTEQQTGEIVEERTENTKTFYNGNGKYTEKIYFEPIHTKESGEKTFEDISPDLKEDELKTNIVTTENTAIDTEFLQKMDNGKYANFSNKGHSMSLSILHASGENKTTLDASDVEATFVENSNKIVHNGIFPQIDLQNYTFNQNTKEDLVLHKYDGYHIFTFKIQTDLKASIDEAGNIQMKDKNDKKIFELPKPFMSDSNYNEGSGDAVTSDKVNYDIKETEDGYILTLNADKEWLASPDRVFPIFIDPTTSVTDSSDSFVMSAYPTTNYSSTSSKWDSGLGEYILKVGYYDSTTGTCYAFLNQPLPEIDGLTVTSATFNAYVTHSASSSATDLWLDRITQSWSNSSVTWNTKPSSTNLGKDTVTANSWASFDITGTVKSWQQGTLTNYGLKLHTNGNGQSYWKKIVSTSNSNNNPYLSVNYTIPTPVVPKGTAFSSGNGTGYVSLDWDPIPGATGYNVWIYNGTDYEKFPVGTATSFTTKDKNIWPTASSVTSGRRALYHTANSGGQELPLDPSYLYKASGGAYPTNKNYWFRISAIYPLGESVMSNPFTPTIPDLQVPAPPTGTSYSNGNGTGYIDFKWNSIPGATSYNIWLFNGKTYESVNVGNVTSWSTKGKKYWPTQTEINAGKYGLHLSDSLGAELPVDPSKTYANAGTTYATSKRYYIRVSAVNSLGESVYSPTYFGPTVPDLLVPAPPTGRAYTNATDSQTGYVNLNWKKITGATGYKVWVYNGKDYESYDVGDTDYWTTQNKGIWPTQAEIDSGVKNLHHPKQATDPFYGGQDLPLEPFKLYAKNGTTYATSPYYYFRVSAYDGNGETVFSSTYYRTVIGQQVQMLGLEDYWSYASIPGGQVNSSTGNFITTDNDFSIGGKGPGISIDRTYNSNSKSSGLFGNGWQSNLDISLTVDGNNVQYVDEDGTLLTFVKNGTAYDAPTGVYLTLKDNGTNFTLEDTDQTVTTFDKTTGKVIKVEDGYKVATTYSYDTDGNLKSITDSSGRKLDFDVQNGLIKSISLPASRLLKYDYDENNNLTQVTGTNGEVTKYDYNALSQLEKIHSPVETEGHSVSSLINYMGDRVSNVQDELGHDYQLNYDITNRNLTVTEPDGTKNQFWYNLDGNPSSVIEDLGGLNITTKTEYEGNNLTKSFDPNDSNSQTPTESNVYDAKGNVTKSTTSYGTEDYKYNSNNDVTSYTDTENKNFTTTYDNQDAISEIDQGNTVAGYSKFDQYGNVLESSDDLSSGTNLLTNSSFENGITGWTVVKSNDNGTMVSDTIGSGGIKGNKSIKLSTISTSPSQMGFIYAYQNVNNIKENTSYTISSDIKTNLTDSNAFYNIYFYNASGTKISSIDNRSSQLKGAQNWTNRQFTFKTPSGTTKIGIFLEIDHYTLAGTGDAWLDNVQLEKSEVQSIYNPVENAGFENGVTSWTGTGGTNDTVEQFEEDNSLKIVRSSSTAATNEYKQTVLIGQKSNDKPIALAITGMSKSANVLVNGTKDSTKYALKSVIRYTDGTSSTITASFLDGTNEWNRAYKEINASKPVSSVDLSIVFGGNFTGTAWFDGIRLIEGKYLTNSTYYNGDYLETSTDADNNVTSFQYDTYGNKTVETDAKGITKSYEYDNGNQLHKVFLNNNTTIIQYDYNLDGTLKDKQISNFGKDQNYHYEYDDNGNLTTTKGPLGDITTNKYDDKDQLTETTLPSGSIISKTYDKVGNVKTVSSNNELSFSYDYDKNGNQLTVKNEKSGEVTSSFYDTKNRVISQTKGSTDQTWIYPSNSDKLSSTSYSRNEVVIDSTSFTYNSLDQNTKVTNGTSSYFYNYDELGNVRSYFSGNNTVSNYYYNNRNLVDSLNITLDNGNTLLKESYEYDENGNRKKILLPNSQSIVYTYDSLDQLKSEEYPDGTLKEYIYDGFGNRKSIKVTKSGNVSETISEFNDENQLIKYGNDDIYYDLDGNRKSDNNYNYKWNTFGQLISVTKKSETDPFVTYEYDDQGRRTKKTLNGTIINYFYDGDSNNVLYESDSSGNILRSYVYSESGERLSMKTQGQTFYYHYNAHGDVIALSDDNKNVVVTYSYDAWGNVLTSTGAGLAAENPYGYAGYIFDKELKMYYLMARYYNPEQGVFLSLDPHPGDDDDSITQNGYTYGDNNPVMLTDPDGDRARYNYGAHERGETAFQIGCTIWDMKQHPDKYWPKKVSKKRNHSVYTLVEDGKVVYVGRTKNTKSRKNAHKKNHPNATFNVVKSGLSYKEARGLEHRLYLKNGGKAKLRNKIRPISKKNKNYSTYMRASRGVYRSFR
ncbi:DNRLRE domain-containing protein [Bacillus sp. UNCCL81]|uniref:DNRLRE domain-containing protein n=1 Tax=Bacillus sp. UNCCL81 TaxID=1502755 RepID=UPI0008E217E3|nr:DNRLRE domain-containing protein [Bacillus sp. UNCCL81]SFC42453.1 RHS repeat-associated core domain-containing protein [Bacillus sp. UNCCL81]